MPALSERRHGRRTPHHPASGGRGGCIGCVRLGDMLLARERRPVQLRYDIVSLYWTGWRFVVRFIPNAFEA
ncbi:MAG TPA: hypothetical protein VI670_25770 [Thermoanaerobaculia bacterium]|jgi:hypothetical protein